MCDAQGNVIPPSRMGKPEGTPEVTDVTDVTVELAETDGRTRMTMTHAAVPAGSGGEGGWKQAFDKLEAVLLGAD
ncbi:SRPBCC domain-containing protein [Altererythrobacter sp. CAU 1778]